VLRELDRGIFTYLMSCWAETEAAKHKRWCARCSKCARIYLYLAANGIDPEEEAGFQDNLLEEQYAHLFNVFGHAEGTGFDAFGTNRGEQVFAFYLAYLRGRRDPLVENFAASPMFCETAADFEARLEEYFGLHPEKLSPMRYKSRIDALFSTALSRTREEIAELMRKTRTG
jgi:hypothetical protein